MKQVFPWLMSPGGRLASFSSSSRRFFSQYSSCGVCLLLCLIIDGGCLDVRSHRKKGYGTVHNARQKAGGTDYYSRVDSVMRSAGRECQSVGGGSRARAATSHSVQIDEAGHEDRC